MWLLVFATLFNSFASQQDVINKIRVGFGGLVLGIMETLAFLLFTYAFVFGDTISQRFPNRRHPRMLVWMLAILIIGDIFGTVAALVHHVDMGYFLRSWREYTTWPVFIFVGYRLLATPASARRFLYVVIAAGAIVSTMLLLNFGQNTEHFGDTMDVNSLRSVAYMNAYSGMTAWLLIYSVISGNKLLPSVVAIPLACYCLVGQCSPLNRGEWMAMFFCAGGLLALLPAGRRLPSAIKVIVVGGLLLAGGTLAITIVTSVTQRNFGEVLHKRFQSMLPTEREGKEAKAWDTRLDSIFAELRMWESYPITGGGFAIQEALVYSGKVADYHAFNHNGWASVLAKTGIFGFVGSLLIPISMMLLGRKLAMNAVDPGIRLMGALAFMSSLYMFAGILAGILWTTRYALFFATVCGMLFRCSNFEASNETDETVSIEEHDWEVNEDNLPLPAHDAFSQL